VDLAGKSFISNTYIEIAVSPAFAAVAKVGWGWGLAVFADAVAKCFVIRRLESYVAFILFCTWRRYRKNKNGV
jgi:hypothetical protein